MARFWHLDNNLEVRSLNKCFRNIFTDPGLSYIFELEKIKIKIIKTKDKIKNQDHY